MIIKNIEQEIKDSFQLLGCAQLYDAAMKYSYCLTIPLKSRTSIKKLAGPIFPIITDNDMLPCLQALDLAPRGSVLFIHNISAEYSEALAGDIFVTAAREQGLGGLIVNGAVRDIDVIDNMGFPVFSKEVTFVSAKTANVASTSVPATIKLPNVVLEPGDWIFADSDGVLLVKQKFMGIVYKAAMVLSNREEDLRIKLLDKNRLSDLCGLHDYLEGRAPLKFDA
jgi:4-hydroxy-4-methyl-2-oxoglutarate aldolase